MIRLLPPLNIDETHIREALASLSGAARALGGRRIREPVAEDESLSLGDHS